MRKQLEKKDSLIRSIQSGKDKLAHQANKKGKGPSKGYHNNNGNNGYYKNNNGGYKRNQWNNQNPVGSGDNWKKRKY